MIFKFFVNNLWLYSMLLFFNALLIDWSVVFTEKWLSGGRDVDRLLTKTVDRVV